MKTSWLSNKRIAVNDIVFLLMYVVVFSMISQHGILKYIVLSIGAIMAFYLRQKTYIKYYNIIFHALIYSALGTMLCLLNGSFTFSSIKQIMIYICPGIFSIGLFALYGKKKSSRLLDIQLIGLCITYLMLYAHNFTLEEFYYESDKYAYIFGAYGLFYFWQKKYYLMIFSIIFMLFDHKRIAEFAFLAMMIISLVIRDEKTEKKRVLFNKIAALFLLIFPIIWIGLLSSGVLELMFIALSIHSMGRLDGQGAWVAAKDYYDFSFTYIGKGVGWVINWLENAGISHFPLLHNDLLVGYIELGFIGYIIWLLSFHLIVYRIKNNHIVNLIYVLIGFMFINFLTDNTYIYVTWLLPFYTMLLSILYSEES